MLALAISQFISPQVDHVPRAAVDGAEEGCADTEP